MKTVRLFAIGLGFVPVLLCGVASGGWGDVAGKPARSITPPAAYSPEDLATFSKRFTADIWPLLTRSSSNCTGCHTASNASQLHLPSTPEESFKTLLSSGHLDPNSASSLLARVSASSGQIHMPPAPLPAWTRDEISVLRSFVEDLHAARRARGLAADEAFPEELTTPYSGKKPPTQGKDDTFLTYYQLRGKVKAIFHDDWRRDEKDLYAENLAQFGGADFHVSFNENTRPTAQFLSGVDMLSRDVMEQAYLNATGPFTGRAPNLPPPLNLKAPTPVYTRQIDRLYRSLLFRSPTPAELQSSFRFLQSIYHAQKDLQRQDYDLRFTLEARDSQGLTAEQNLKIHVSANSLGLGQTLVDENAPGGEENAKVGRCTLNGPFTFKAGDAAQKVVVSNIGSRGNLVVHGMEVRGPLPDGPTRSILISDSGVQPQGAWKQTQQDGIACYEDGNQSKGDSVLTFPVNVEKDGTYEVTFTWRKSETRRGGGGRNRRVVSTPNASQVLVEVVSHDKSRIAMPPSLTPPPKGEARFTVDESDDTRSEWKAAPLFKFGDGDGIEITNANTQGQVTADSVRFAPVIPPTVTTGALANATAFYVNATEAQGQTSWKDFVRGQFLQYKAVGPRLVSDSNDPELKGKLRLFYSPTVRNTDFVPSAFYRIEVGYPGTVQNDTAVPVAIHARESSPILQVTYPYFGHTGAELVLDASGSYNVQATPLQLTWRQVSGPPVTLPDPHASRLSFLAPTESAQAMAWEGLGRALMKHPDFLFTRPVSLATVQDPRDRRRLLLVKIAQDLVARTPNEAELAKLDHGASLASMVDYYLGTQEFKDFYFRRIRLYLESHGTEEDDEPARLWSYIAFNDRPFKEILTADYTVNTDWKQEPRPAYCGKSGVLTMKGFIKGKQGLPHFNYSAMVCEKFLGYVFEVPPEILKIRDGIAAASTTAPNSICYSCHKMLTPLAFQRSRWTDDGVYQAKFNGKPIDDSDHQLVASYPFKGNGMEAFALQAQNKERFIRTMIQTHFVFYFGREMRYDRDERGLYRRLWNTELANNYSIRGLIRALLTSPEYLESAAPTVKKAAVQGKKR